MIIELGTATTETKLNSQFKTDNSAGQPGPNPL